MEKKVLQIEKQLFDIQQKALRLQMNPHFIFNSLNSIQSYILNNDVDLAVNYLGRFSQLMRLILANSRESVVPLADELEAIRHYLEIEKLRFEDKFTYTIIVDPEIDDEFAGVPPMVIQPYIENAIIHGLVHKPLPGHITIRIKEKNSRMLCIIEDNGIGRAKAAEIKRQSGLNTKSRGMMITKERLEILNRKTDDKFTIKVIDLKDKDGKPAGTRVELLITPQEL
jgi:sensor histidine kinase YesM